MSSSNGLLQARSASKRSSSAAASSCRSESARPTCSSSRAGIGKFMSSSVLTTSGLLDSLGEELLDLAKDLDELRSFVTGHALFQRPAHIVVPIMGIVGLNGYLGEAPHGVWRSRSDIWPRWLRFNVGRRLRRHALRGAVEDAARHSNRGTESATIHRRHRSRGGGSDVDSESQPT